MVNAPSVIVGKSAISEFFDGSAAGLDAELAGSAEAELCSEAGELDPELVGVLGSAAQPANKTVAATSAMIPRRFMPSTLRAANLPVTLVPPIGLVSLSETLEMAFAVIASVAWRSSRE
jgi:hypothetical protein